MQLGSVFAILCIKIFTHLNCHGFRQQHQKRDTYICKQQCCIKIDILVLIAKYENLKRSAHKSTIVYKTVFFTQINYTVFFLRMLYSLFRAYLL